VAPREYLGREHIFDAISERLGWGEELRADETCVFSTALHLELGSNGKQLDPRATARRPQTRESPVLR
jgi:hypothetical protein